MRNYCLHEEPLILCTNNKSTFILISFEARMQNIARYKSRLISNDYKEN